MALGATSGGSDKILVMIVDDSAIIRGLYRKLISEETDMTVIADASNGELALTRLARGEVDVIVLDVEMPVMDGMTAIPKLLEVQPDVQIVMSSTLTERNAEIALKALEIGAKDYIQKPTSKADIALDGAFRSALCHKIRELGKLRRTTKDKQSSPAAGSAAKAPASATSTISGWRNHHQNAEVAGNLRPVGKTRPKVLVVGSSTGGPQALQRFFAGLDRNLGLPVLAVQHMPPTFTAILAGHINKATGWPCREAVNGDTPLPNEILLAPGGFHMVLANKLNPHLELNEEPPENFCRPAVDPLFRSAADVYGSAVLGVILTGMGNDGAKGAVQITEAGGTIIVQDEKTSVVWGMPGAAAAAGVCSRILPLDELPAEVQKITRGMAA